MSARSHRLLLGLTIAVVAGTMFVLNTVAPFVSDDYGTVTAARAVHSFAEFRRAAEQNYLQWDGRTMSATLATTFGRLDKSAFNVGNTIVFVAFTLLLLAHGRGRRRLDARAYWMVCLLVWFASPVFGQTYLWLLGSVVHLWPLVLVLAFMLPFRRRAGAGLPRGGIAAIAAAAAMFLLGVLAGWASVNVSLALIVWVGLVIFDSRRRGDVLPTWMWSGAAGAIIGYIILTAAPGNWSRNAVQVQEHGLVERFFRYLYFAFNDGVLVALGVCLVLLVVLRLTGRDSREALRTSTAYAVAAVIATGVMIAAPVYSPRVLLGPLAFLFIAAGVLFAEVDLEDSRVTLPLAAVGVVCTAALLVQLAGGAYDIRLTGQKLADRDAYVREQKAQGNLDVVVEAVVPQTRFNPLWELYDVTGDKDFWSNQQVAQYYGVRSITGRLPAE